MLNEEQGGEGGDLQASPFCFAHDAIVYFF